MIRFTLQKDYKKDVPLAAVAVEKVKGLVWTDGAKSLPAEALAVAKEDGFQGKNEESAVIRLNGKSPAARIVVLSAGKAADSTLHGLRKAAAAAFKRASDAKLARLSFLLPNQFAPLAEEVQAVVEGFLLAAYRFNRHKSAASADAALSELSLVVPEREIGSLKEAVRRGEAFAGSVNFARDLINEPPSMKVPEVLGKKAKSLAGNGVSVKVYDKAAIRAMKMDALLGVNRGSAHPPVLVHLHYKPSVRPRRKLAFVGKGITFDSGGLSLKPADGMMTMKYDMAGAASVFSLFKALAVLKPPVEVHGVAPVTENMPGHDAYKPGDVVRAANGKTIEVLNTDAEGRVVLADALSYASKLDVDEIVDIATLTGAVAVALGKSYAGVMANDDEAFERLRRSAEKAGEKVWRLPLEPSYKEHIASKVADLKNIGNPGEAGTIIGGLFLQEFVDDRPWVHIDMAGVGWNGGGTLLSAPGATGAMVRTLLHYILG